VILSVAERAWTVLAEMVDNNGGDGAPVGDVTWSLEYERESGRYSVRFEAGECNGLAEAPTLALAVLAASHMSEGGYALVDDRGRLLCSECDGAGETESLDGRVSCDECQGLRYRSNPPYGWPDGGLNLDDATPVPERSVQTCRVCGCTDDDCSQCIERTGAPCCWEEHGLCSACVCPSCGEEDRVADRDVCHACEHAAAAESDKP
jgi:hypothetical protein